MHVSHFKRLYFYQAALCSGKIQFDDSHRYFKRNLKEACVDLLPLMSQTPVASALPSILDAGPEPSAGAGGLSTGDTEGSGTSERARPPSPGVQEGLRERDGAGPRPSSVSGRLPYALKVSAGPYLAGFGQAGLTTAPQTAALTPTPRTTPHSPRDKSQAGARRVHTCPGPRSCCPAQEQQLVAGRGSSSVGLDSGSPWAFLGRLLHPAIREQGGGLSLCPRGPSQAHSKADVLGSRLTPARSWPRGQPSWESLAEAPPKS